MTYKTVFTFLFVDILSLRLRFMQRFLFVLLGASVRVLFLFGAFVLCWLQLKDYGE